MMKRKSHKDASQKLALVISFFLHTLLLLGAYYLPLRQLAGSSSEYSIVLSTAVSHQESASEDTTIHPLPFDQLAKDQAEVENKKARRRIQPATNQEKMLEDAVPELQDTPSKETAMEQVESPVQDLPEASTAVNQKEEVTNSIDERSLYKIHQGKQTDTLLELAGWMWDTVPEPQDNTDEIGKIIFQITIDEFGEVIAIKTLEKTISPLVEKIYKESLTRLTFSKTSDNLTYTPASTGKVTFILQVK